VYTIQRFQPFNLPTHTSFTPQVHHILAEIIQGGLVLETNVEEIDQSGWFLPFIKCFGLKQSCPAVQNAAKVRKDSFASANPLALGVSGGVGHRSGSLQTPLGWLTGRLTGVGAR
jgi:AP-3 complex subunit sigma